MIMNIIFKNEYNMKIKKSKIKILVWGRNEVVKPYIILDGNTLETVDECKYLGSMINNYGGCAQEIRWKLQQAQCVNSKKGRVYF